MQTEIRGQYLRLFFTLLEPFPTTWCDGDLCPAGGGRHHGVFGLHQRLGCSYMSRWRTLFPQVSCVVTGSVVLTSPTGGFNVADDRCRLSNRCQEYGLYPTCWDSLSGCPHTLHTDTHFTCILYSSCCNASCLYGWMGAWFEACLWSPLRQGTGSDGFMFHDMLYWHSALLSLPGSSRVCPANSNRIHPKLTTLYNSPFAFLILFLLILFLLLVTV